MLDYDGAIQGSLSLCCLAHSLSSLFIYVRGRSFFIGICIFGLTVYVVNFWTILL